MAQVIQFLPRAPAWPAVAADSFYIEAYGRRVSILSAGLTSLDDGSKIPVDGWMTPPEARKLAAMLLDAAKQAEGEK